MNITPVNPCINITGPDHPFWSGNTALFYLVPPRYCLRFPLITLFFTFTYLLVYLLTYQFIYFCSVIFYITFFSVSSTNYFLFPFQLQFYLFIFLSSLFLYDFSFFSFFLSSSALFLFISYIFTFTFFFSFVLYFHLSIILFPS